MSKVILQGYIVVPDTDLPVVAAELPAHILATRNEPGCLMFEVTRSSEQPGRFDVYEEFVDATAFEYHQARVKASKWGSATRQVNRHYEISGLEQRPEYVPPGWPAVVPRLSVSDPAGLVEFVKRVFGAVGEYHESRPSEMMIAGSLIMIGGDIDRASTSSSLYVYVADTDTAYRTAITLGAKSVEAPQEMSYGDRRAMIVDPWGNRWQIATHRGFTSQSQQPDE